MHNVMLLRRQCSQPRRLAMALLGYATVAVLPATAQTTAPATIPATKAAPAASIHDTAALAAAVHAQVPALLQQYQIPGMALAVLWRGQPHFYSFGLAEKQHKTPVSPDTLFEIGSVSKTYAGVMGALALQQGKLTLSDPVSKHWPALNGPQWQGVTMAHLATYTAGGLPLQFPPAVTDAQSMQQFYQQWQPQWPAGQQRQYGNTSIGLFAHLAVKTGGQPYATALQQALLTPLQLQHTYTKVPAAAQHQYAWGYADGQAVRLNPGMLLDEAGGLKSSARDLAKWLQAHLQPAAGTPASVQAALQLAQQRYAQSGQMYQGLGWEMLDYPVTLAALKATTDPAFVKGSPAQLLTPAGAAKPDSWVHKTGATNGFAAYVAFIPSRQVGIVMLANQRYPNAERVQLAYQLLQSLQ